MGIRFGESEENRKRIFLRDDDIELEKVDGPQTRRFLEEVIRKEVAPDIPRLVELARSVGSKIAMLPDLSCTCCDCRDPNRPNFGPMQVRHLCQIKEGLKYRIVRHTDNDEPSDLHKVIREPYQSSSDGKWAIETMPLSPYYYPHHSFGIPIELFLCYLNIVPFEDSREWARFMWLEFAKDSEHLAGPHTDHCSCCRHHYQETK